MHIFRCYLLNSAGHIAEAEWIEAEALDEAVDRAFALLRERPLYDDVEIWHGAWRLYPVRRASDAVGRTGQPPRL